MSTMTTPREVPVREESIRLGQFLKLADLVENGGDAKPLLLSGLVSVNGQSETRRGRQLHKGDVVVVGQEEVRVG
jgi:ribosome-associated protein